MDDEPTPEELMVLLCIDLSR